MKLQSNLTSRETNQIAFPQTLTNMNSFVLPKDRAGSKRVSFVKNPSAFDFTLENNKSTGSSNKLQFLLKNDSKMFDFMNYMNHPLQHQLSLTSNNELTPQLLTNQSWFQMMNKMHKNQEETEVKKNEQEKSLSITPVRETTPSKDLKALRKRPSRRQFVKIEARNNQSKELPRMRVACICKKTQCNKLYCICFKNGLECSEFCNCKDCKNTDPAKAKTKRIFLKKVLKKLRHQYSGEVKEDCCNCRKSFCQSKYCSCFNLGGGCKPSCTCFSCRNKFGKRPPINDKVSSKSIPKT